MPTIGPTGTPQLQWGGLISQGSGSFYAAAGFVYGITLPADLSSGPVIVLPTTPPDGSQVEFVRLDSGNTTPISAAPGGSDTIEGGAGAVSILDGSLTFVFLQGRWYSVGRAGPGFSGVWGPTTALRANSVAARDAYARIQSADPANASDVGTKGYIDSADQFRATVHLVGAAGEPAFQNAWVNYNATPGYQLAGFWLDRDGTVHLQGLVKGGTIATGSTGVIFTLPAGYRPGGASIYLATFAASSGSVPSYGRLQVGTDGSVIAYASAGTNGFLSLDGITFRQVN